VPILIGILWLGIAPNGALKQIDVQSQLAVPSVSVASDNKGLPSDVAQGSLAETLVTSTSNGVVGGEE
jgi:hypothetical protein